ncbi:hypothetical protein [Aestuariimicrobium sp. Y1814]|uniref:hypothetical protein n=1 Tax=Aestuariimicrobium sp. Y1814 TaxID=3418742 RepID=UPI003DA70CA0
MRHATARLRAVLAAGIACVALVGCTGGDKPLSVDHVREQASARVTETGADGVAELTLSSTGGGIVLRKGNQLTSYGVLCGGGSVGEVNHLSLGAKPVDELPIQELVDARAAADQQCKDVRLTGAGAGGVRHQPRRAGGHHADRRR